MQLFSEHQNWYKGNTHTHTTRSDGALSPEETIVLYKSKGYDFLCITDHNIQSETVDEKDFLLLSSIELDCIKDYSAFHIVGIGLKKPIESEKTTEPQKLIDSVTAAGGIAILAHPAWSLMTTAETLKLKGLSGAEVFNSVSRPPFNGDRADSSSFLDVLATYGLSLPLFAADDSHFYKGDECYAFIYVNAPKLTEEDILQSIKSGKFYASQGPKFHQIEVIGDEILIKCSPCNHAIFYSNTLWTSNRVQEKENSESFSYKINANDRFVRCELGDSDGKKAWSGYIKVK